jgi:DNA-binding response OmpR family regulator
MMDTKQRMKVLVVEDDADIGEVLRFYFEAKGHQVLMARDGLEALAQWRRNGPDLMLLDVMLPKLDGWSVLEAVRAESQIPVILITALDNTDHVVKGLALGADDYLRKPFEVRELEARIRSITRRLEAGTGHHLMVCGPIRIDDRAKTVTVDGEPVPLSPKEYELLRLLAQDPGRVFTNQEIIDTLWGAGQGATGADVKQYIYQLRNRIEADPHAPRRIQNVKGFGYKLVVQSPSPGACPTDTTP